MVSLMAVSGRNGKEGRGTMGRKMLILLMAVSLGGAWASLGFAGELGYTMDAAEKGFKTPYEPNSAVMLMDAVVARPLGLATSIAGAGVFVVTLPFSLPSGSVGPAARGLVGQPAGWTFLRPLGQGDPRFEDRGVFSLPESR
jgi:hypothetical protein